MYFSNQELARYSRHIILDGFGIEGQQKLKNGSILVIGAGGLGSPILQYLAAAGVGTIGIIDFDKVEESNLQRQVLYTISDLQQPKALTAKLKLLDLNPYITIQVYQEQLTSENAFSILKKYDIIVDGTDNFPTRYLVNDACVILNKPLVYGSIYKYEGQVSVFNLQNDKGQRSVNYRDLYPTPPPPDLVPNCAEGGVIGVLAGIIGSMQANEAIKILAGIGETLSGRLFIFDALDFTTRTIKIKKNKTLAPITHLIDYDEFCGLKTEKNSTSMVKEITVQQLKAMKDNGEDFQLIDVREGYEYEIVNIGGELMPLGEIMNHVEDIATDKKVVIHCRSGARSASACMALQQHFGLDNLYNLKGGVLAYATEIDPSLPKY